MRGSSRVEEWRSRHGARVVPIGPGAGTFFASFGYTALPLTLCAWLKPLGTSVNTVCTIVGVAITFCQACVLVTDYVAAGIPANTNNLIAATDAGNSAAITGPAVGTWAFVVLTVTASRTGQVFWRPTTATFASTAVSPASASGSFSTVGIGAGVLFGPNALACGFKAFPYILSLREMYDESRQLAPVSNRCISYLPMRAFSRIGNGFPYRDECAGNGRQLWSGATAGNAANVAPPVPEVAARRVLTFLSLSSPPVTGTIAQSLGRPVQAMAGVVQPPNPVPGEVWLQGRVISPTLAGNPIAPTLQGRPIRPTLSGKPIAPNLSGRVVDPTGKGTPI